MFPLVTIGVINYNYSRYIIQALNSVVSQSYSNIELIIIDDFSTDDSVKIIENWLRNYKGNVIVKFIKNIKNAGLTRNCNVVLEHTNGKYFQPLDADDILMPEKIEKQVEILESSEKNGMVYSNVSVIDETGTIINPDYCNRIGYNKEQMPQGDILDQLIDFNFISLPSVLLKTSEVNLAGGFDESLGFQDYYMWLKIAEKHQVMYMPEVTAFYRVHNLSMSNNPITRPAFVSSILDLRFRYFKKIDKKAKKKMARNIHFASVYLYQHNYSTSKKWLSVALKIYPSFKTLLYFVAIRLNVPFTIFSSLKKFRSILK